MFRWNKTILLENLGIYVSVIDNRNIPVIIVLSGHRQSSSRTGSIVIAPCLCFLSFVKFVMVN